MKRRAIGGLILGALGLAPLSVTAQQATPDPRKPFFNEDGKPIPRAVPVERPIPRAIPIEKPGAPAPGAAATPRPAGPPEPEEPGTIRMTPGGTPRTADQTQLDLADGYYSRKIWDQAAAEYERYLGLYPNGQDREAAYFRLAESYRHLGTMNAAKTAYETLLQTYGSGDFIGPASYRLADIYYGEKQFRDALTLYRKASVRVKEPAVANAAKFFSARCLEGLGEKLEARVTYEDLVAAPRDNPFYDASRLSLALLLKDGGRTADALKQIQALAKQTGNSDLKLEATVRSGLWSLELDPPLTAQADAAFKAALALPGKGYWKELAQLGQVRILSDASKFEQVLEICDRMGADVSADVKPELLMLEANAQRQLNKNAGALATYAEVIKDFPGSVYDKDAQYQRLRTMYATNDDALVAEIDKYLQANPEEQKRDEVLLMKAEVLFKKEDFAGAMEIYSALELSRQLTGNRKAEALFRLGWCEIQTKNLDKAIKTFTAFINGYSSNKLVPFALLQRGLASQSLKDLSAALKDYDAIIRGYPQAPQRELALQQQALIQGQQGNNAAMAASFKQLIKEFPDTAARAQADYWIGWAAFEDKHYKEALPHLEEARKRDKEQFGEKAGIRVLLSEYYLEDKDATAREADLYARQGKTKVPPEILRWLGKSFHDAGSHESAEKYLTLLTGREEVMPEDFQLLAESQIALGKFQPAISSLQSYLKSTKLPVPRARGLLLLAQAQIGLGAYDDAQKSVDEALTLQPEGEVSGRARIVAGDIQKARKNYEDAAKIYESVAVILDDPTVTPQALEKAVEAWRAAGRQSDADKAFNKLRSRYPEFKAISAP
jgi:TolA-binding protein